MYKRTDTPALVEINNWTYRVWCLLVYQLSQITFNAFYGTRTLLNDTFVP